MADIVVDVNILLAALIRDSTTRRIIRKTGEDLYFPEPSLMSVEKYAPYIREKARLSQMEYHELLGQLLRFIKMIPKKKILERWERAYEIMGHIDKEDVTIIAGALSLGNAMIWSEDGDFDEQDSVQRLTTRQMLQRLTEQQVMEKE